MARATTSDVEDRWEARPGLAAVVRVVTFLVPVAASTFFAMFVSALLPPASSRLVQIVTFGVIAVASTGVLMLVDRAARRLLPLAALLNLSIVFPDQAPSRYKVARRAGGVRSLEARLEHARRLGVEDEPTRAAALILELVTALQRHDRRTRGHSERVHLFTEMLARELDLPEHDRDRLRWAALVHDVGKLAVPEEILNKPSAPEPDEWEHLRQHPIEGARLCRALRPWMGHWWDAIEQHHEHYDGSGYPRGLAGTDISLGARIVSVADSFEVITAARSYKRAKSAAAGREELSRCAGTQFDPAIVRAFLNISLGRLRLALGPLAWLAQFPALEGVIRADTILRLVGGLVAATTTAVLVGAPTQATGPREPAAALGGVVASETPPVGETRAAVATPEQPTEQARTPRLPVLAPPGPADAFAADDREGSVGAGPATVVAPPAPAVPPAVPPVPPPADVPPGAVPPAVPPPGQPDPPPADVPPSPDPGEPVATPSPSPTLPPSPEDTSEPPTSPPTPTPPAPVGTPPVPAPDAASTAEDTPTTIAVTANDVDPDGDPLTVTTASDGANGSTTVNGDGTVTYVPDPDVHGLDSFTYVVSDGTDSVSTTVTVTVRAVNDAPSFVAGPDQTIGEDAGPQTVPNWATGISPGPPNEAGQTTSFSVTADDPTLFAVAPAIDAATGALRYTTAADANGATTVTVTLTDDGGTADGGSDTSASVTFDLVVTPVNDPPVAGDDSYVVQVGVPLDVPAPGVVANDHDADDDPLTVTAHSAPPLAVATLTVNADGSLTYSTLLPGPQTFTYTVSDGAGETDTATATVTAQVLPVASSTFYLGTSGSAADTYALADSAPPVGNPEPDHDSDGEPGLTINSSGGKADDADPAKYQHWTRTFGTATTYDGQVRLALWSTVEDFEEEDDGHYYVYLHDCASDGTDCTEVLQSDAHVEEWNDDVEDWVFKDLALGSLDHTFTAGRMLRVRLMFGHNPMWVGLSGSRPTRIILEGP